MKAIHLKSELSARWNVGVCRELSPIDVYTRLILFSAIKEKGGKMRTVAKGKDSSYILFYVEEAIRGGKLRFFCIGSSHVSSISRGANLRSDSD